MSHAHAMLEALGDRAWDPSSAAPSDVSMGGRSHPGAEDLEEPTEQEHEEMRLAEGVAPSPALLGFPTLPHAKAISRPAQAGRPRGANYLREESLLSERAELSPEQLDPHDVTTAITLGMAGMLPPAHKPRGAFRPMRRIKPRHVRIAQLAAQGLTAKQIARRLEQHGVRMHPQYVTRLLSDPMMKSLIAKMLGAAAKHLETQDLLTHIAPEVAIGLGEMFRTTKSEAIKAKVGFGILDRAGYGPTTKHKDETEPGKGKGAIPQEVVGMFGRLTDALIASQRAKEIPYVPGMARVLSGGEESAPALSDGGSGGAAQSADVGPSPANGSPVRTS